jgi:hypothetical protein
LEPPESFVRFFLRNPRVGIGGVGTVKRRGMRPGRVRWSCEGALQVRGQGMRYERRDSQWTSGRAKVYCSIGGGSDAQESGMRSSWRRGRTRRAHRGLLVEAGGGEAAMDVQRGRAGPRHARLFHAANMDSLDTVRHLKYYQLNCIRSSSLYCSMAARQLNAVTALRGQLCTESPRMSKSLGVKVASSTAYTPTPTPDLDRRMGARVNWRSRPSLQANCITNPVGNRLISDC